MSIDTLVKALSASFANFQIIDAIDILIVTVLLYIVIKSTKHSRAFQVLKGIGIAFVALILSQLMGLNTLNWILNAVFGAGIVVIAILFQPELRRALEHIGRGQILMDKDDGKEAQEAIDELSHAVLSLSKRRVGALIVFERKTALGDIIASGTLIDGHISAPLVENIFEPNTPLHDGAMIIRDDKIIAAACFLPLTDDIAPTRDMGTRHRAALSLSTVSDSVTIVVSEETGIISYAKEGRFVRYLDAKALGNLLESLFSANNSQKNLLSIFKRSKDD